MLKKKFISLVLLICICVFPIGLYADGEESTAPTNDESIVVEQIQEENQESSVQTTENSEIIDSSVNNEETTVDDSSVKEESNVVEENSQTDNSNLEDSSNVQPESTPEPIAQPTKQSTEQPTQEPTSEPVLEQSKENSEETKVEEVKVEETKTEDTTTTKNGDTSAYKAETKYYTPEIFSKLRYPLSYTVRVSSGYGPREPVMTPEGWSSTYHNGIDLPAPVGTPVLAAESGTITYASWGNGFGNVVYIEHLDGVVTIYAHLSQINVTVGQKVIRGQMVGKVGSTGKSSGPHLHFEVRPKGVDPVDPTPYLSEPNTYANDYANIKFLFVKNSVEVSNLQTTHVKPLLREDILLEEEVTEQEETKLFTPNDVIFQLNELFEVYYENDKTIIDVSKFYHNGLIKNDPIYIQTAGDYNAEFIKEPVYAELPEVVTIKRLQFDEGEIEPEILYYNYKIVLDKEVNQSEIQLIINSDEIEPKNVITYINSEFPTLDSNIYKFNPLFNIELDLNIEEITEKNISIKVDGKDLSHDYFDYEDGKLTIKYSCLYLTELEINITEEETEYEESNNIQDVSNITTWIDVDNIDLFSISSFIDNCYVFSDLQNNKVKTDYFLPQYNKYNFKWVDNNIESIILVDNELGDVYISIPVQLGTTEMHMNTDVDPATYFDKKPNQTLNFDDVEYNPFIYGETLDIKSEYKIEEGYKSVEFKLLDYKQTEDYDYFIIFYTVDEVGGYFGLRMEKTEN